jgi:SAM-dependent methyltransferase
MTRSLDLGCGLKPKNPFNADELYGVDIRESNETVKVADLAVDPIPFQANFFDYCTAFDFLEHIPRVIYAPQRKFCFVDLMSEIYRVLKPGGKFLSFTPAFPAPEAWQDPTHVNIITVKTFPKYFDTKECLAKMYGFKGGFIVEKQYLHTNKIHLITELKKPEIMISTEGS